MQHRKTRNWRAALMGKWGAGWDEVAGDSAESAPVRQYVGASVDDAATDVLTHRRTDALTYQTTESPQLAAVKVILPGPDDDGLVMRHAGQERSWGEHAEIMREALEAWRTNPLARRLVALVTSTCVGDGIRLTSPYAPLEAFLRDFWAHGQNRIDEALPEWSDELSRSGELFLALFTDPHTGMSYVRAVPAAQIDQVEWEEGDYRSELSYRDVGEGIGNVRWWKNPAHSEATPEEPVMVHFAVNRPVGAVRGESDLAPSLVWLKRYAKWLDDRVRLNATMRSFVWVVNVPPGRKAQIAEAYRMPPQPGTVIVASDDEKWTAVNPNLHAADAEMDGRAIRWMIAAGGPGTALIDLGEGEDANLATGAVMQELKRRFLRRRQRVLVEMLKEVALCAFRRWAQVSGAAIREVSSADLVALAPDISPEDNASLAQAAAQMVQALAGLEEIAGSSEEFRRMAVRLFARFAGESLSGEEVERILRRET